MTIHWRMTREGDEMTIGYVLFAIVWGVTVAVTHPPVVVGALLVAIPVILVGLVFRASSEAEGARNSLEDEHH